MRLRKRYLLGFVAIVMGALAASPVSANGAPTLVASRFDNPRGVAFYHGHLMVAEAGRGGRNCSVNPSPPTAGAFCFGRTGKISSVDTATGEHMALVDNLFSFDDFLGGPSPSILGLSGLSARGGKLFAIEGVYPQAFADYACAPGDSQCEEDLAAARKEAGALLSVSHNGTFHVVANVGAFDYDFTAKNQPPHEHDANPYGVLATKGGVYVADAGSNTLDFVNMGGRIKIVYEWRNIYAGFPHDEVPTCVTRAGDSLWVATLTGNLYRVRGTSATQVQNSDLKHVTGCVSNGEDTIYFVNMWTNPNFPMPGNGNIVKFNAGEGSSSVIAAGLNFPNMDAIGPDGNLYFSADSVCAVGLPPCPTGGTVWKLALTHGDDDD